MRTDAPVHLGYVVACVLAGLLLSLSGCATVKTCAQPATGQALQDAGAVLVCAADGSKTLAACEERQLAVEAGQLGADALMCAEQVVSLAYSQPHTAAKP